MCNPEEANPKFPPTKNTLPVRAGVTGKASGSPARFDVPAAVSAICVCGGGVSHSGHWEMLDNGVSWG